MPEETERFIRLPNPKHIQTGCQNIRTIAINKSKGISGLYCIDHKSIKTYLFLRAKGWTMETAREWVTSHSKGVSMEKVKTEEKLMNELAEKIKDAVYTKAVKEKDEKGDSVFVVSSDVEDREGEVISTEGWKLENYKAYPVLLWSHNATEPLIGHGTNLRYRTINGKKKLTFTPKFHRKSELSRLVADLVDEDWIRGVSVGFKPIEKEGNVYTKQELLEISLVNVPANQDALRLAMAKGYKEDTIGKVMDVKKAKAMQEKIDRKEKEVEVTKEILEQKKKEAKKVKEDPEKAIEEEKAENKPEEIKPEFPKELSGEETEKPKEKPDKKEMDNERIDKIETTIEKLAEIVKGYSEVFNQSNNKVQDEFKKVRLELKGLNPDGGFDERLSNIEDNLENLAKSLSSNTQGKSEGRADEIDESNKETADRVKILKCLNKGIKALIAGKKELKD